MAVLRSVLFTVIMFLSVPPYTLLIIASRIFGEKIAYTVMVGWVRFIVWLCKVLCGLDYRVEGKENIPDECGVVMIKHSSAYETFIQFLMFPRQSWVLKRELMWAPFFGWALACVKPIAINRNAGRSAVEQVVKQGTALLNDGLWIMIFPEGTRMPVGQTRRYGISGALLADKSKRLLIPVAHNAGYYWPRRSWKKRPGTVRFCIGPPIDPQGRELREVNAEIQDWIEKKLVELQVD
jgi:1-acyl-sn-glycerol-3-phosphate acyltransferase